MSVLLRASALVLPSMDLKRVFDENGNQVRHEDAKRQRMNSVKELVGVRCVQHRLPDLEPFLRRVVQEEVQSVLHRYGHFSNFGLHKGLTVAAKERYRLHFQGSLAQTIFTGNRIDSLNGEPLRVVITDALRQQIVTSGPVSLAKIEIVVLEGDFGSNEQLEWLENDFCEGIVSERQGKRPLLSGEVVIPLINGVGTIRDISFTDNSSWIRSRKFRLGARIHKINCIREKVHEAISSPFLVKDHRGETYKKNHPPSLTDDVWRLERIGKDGVFHRRLAECGINTVQDFLRNLLVAPERLRLLLGNGMSNKMWETTVEHAQKCILDDRLYYYSTDQGVVLLFNCIYAPVGIVFGNNFYTLDKLTPTQKALVKKMQQDAYQLPNQILELKGLDKPLGSSSCSGESTYLLSSAADKLNVSPHANAQGIENTLPGFHELFCQLRQELLDESTNSDGENVGQYCNWQQLRCLPSHSLNASTAGSMHHAASDSCDHSTLFVEGVW